MASISHKRIIVACDGTWVNSDNGFVRDSWLPWKTTGSLATASNVTRLCRALLPKSNENIQQVVYYQGGLGTANSFWSYFFGGYFGDGISENIREAYTFICNNYEDGDEIVLVGFSRGAFTARSVGGLISSIGLLTKHGLGAFYPIFKDWEYQADSKYKPNPDCQSPSWPLPRPVFKEREYLNQLVQKGMTRANIPIKAIGVWDTVGSLGVPTIKLFGWLPIHTDTTKEFSFINTKVDTNIEHAYQALALDEQRAPFAPTVWESPDPQSGAILKVLKQTWFPGVHTSVGGGYADTSISDISLSWMITQLSAHLDFDKNYVPRQRAQNEEFYKTHEPKVVRPWGMGLIQRSDLGAINNATGREVRTPGEYHATDPDSGKTLPRQLIKTCEFIHPSARYRIEQHGAGLASSKKDKIGQGEYHPLALKGWKYIKEGEESEVGGKSWKGYAKWYKPGSDIFIVEDAIEEGTAEMDLMSGWPGVQTKLYPSLV